MGTEIELEEFLTAWDKLPQSEKNIYLNKFVLNNMGYVHILDETGYHFYKYKLVKSKAK